MRRRSCGYSWAGDLPVAPGECRDSPGSVPLPRPDCLPSSASSDRGSAADWRAASTRPPGYPARGRGPGRGPFDTPIPVPVGDARRRLIQPGSPWKSAALPAAFPEAAVNGKRIRTADRRDSLFFLARPIRMPSDRFDTLGPGLPELPGLPGFPVLSLTQPACPSVPRTACGPRRCSRALAVQRRQGPGRGGASSRSPGSPDAASRARRR